MSQNKVLLIQAGSTEMQEKFINCMMKQGKKSIARRIFQETLQIIKDKGKTNPISIFEKALSNVKPQKEVRAKRVGGSVYQIPVEVTSKRQKALSVRWIINACRTKKGKSMSANLAQELIDASNDTGAAYKKREDVHRMAAANKAFAHFARYK